MKDNTRVLLIAQMKRAIELLESDGIEMRNEWHYSKHFAELNNKFHEIRRDSVRFIKECNGRR